MPTRFPALTLSLFDEKLSDGYMQRINSYVRDGRPITEPNTAHNRKAMIMIASWVSVF